MARNESTVFRQSSGRVMREPITFSAFAEQKTREASTAKIGTLTTALDWSESATTRWIGNAWTRLHYEGDFGLVVEPACP